MKVSTTLIIQIIIFLCFFVSVIVAVYTPDSGSNRNAYLAVVGIFSGIGLSLTAALALFLYDRKCMKTYK